MAKHLFYKVSFQIMIFFLILENQISNEGLQIIEAEYSLVSGAVEFLDV